MSDRKTAVGRLTLCALFTALIAVCAQIQLSLPMIPLSLALFAIHLSGSVLGWKYGSLSVIAYIVLGVVGVPVFAGFQGGPGVLFGKTGGYIIGYLLCAFVVGLLAGRWGRQFWKLCASMTLGLAVCYAFGTVWFMALMHMPLWESLLACVIPFLPGDAVKIALAAWVCGRLQKPLRNMGLL